MEVTLPENKLFKVVESTSNQWRPNTIKNLLFSCLVKGLITLIDLSAVKAENSNTHRSIRCKVQRTLCFLFIFFLNAFRYINACTRHLAAILNLMAASCLKTWSLLELCASIILDSSSSGSRITICQLRVKYFSNNPPLFFTSGSTDVSLVSWPFHLPCSLSVKREVEGGVLVRSKEKEEMFLSIRLHLWSSWRSVSVNSLYAPEGKYFSPGIWGMKPEVFCFDPCALHPSLNCPLRAPSHQIPGPGAETGSA